MRQPCLGDRHNPLYQKLLVENLSSLGWTAKLKMSSSPSDAAKTNGGVWNYYRIAFLRHCYEYMMGLAGYCGDGSQET